MCPRNATSEAVAGAASGLGYARIGAVSGRGYLPRVELTGQRTEVYTRTEGEPRWVTNSRSSEAVISALMLSLMFSSVTSADPEERPCESSVCHLRSVEHALMAKTALNISPDNKKSNGTDFDCEFIIVVITCTLE